MGKKSIENRAVRWARGEAIMEQVQTDLATNGRTLLLRGARRVLPTGEAVLVAFTWPLCLMAFPFVATVIITLLYTRSWQAVVTTEWWEVGAAAYLLTLAGLIGTADLVEEVPTLRRAYAWLAGVMILASSWYPNSYSGWRAATVGLGVVMLLVAAQYHD
jgi:hypothetical protein